MALEMAREVTLVAEASGQSDFSNWLGGLGQATARLLDALPAQVLSNSISTVSAKGCGKVYRVQVYGGGDVAERQRLGEVGVQEFADACEPARRPCLSTLGGRAGRFDQQLREKALDHQQGKLVGRAEFLVEPQGQRRQRSALEVGWSIQHGCLFVHAPQPGGWHLDVEGPHLSLVHVLRVHFLRRMKGDGARPALAVAGAICFGIAAAPDQAKVSVFVTVPGQANAGGVARLSEQDVANASAPFQRSKKVTARQPFGHGSLSTRGCAPTSNPDGVYCVAVAWTTGANRPDLVTQHCHFHGVWYRYD
jgi:hypothetical protein